MHTASVSCSSHTVLIIFFNSLYDQKVALFYWFLDLNDLLLDSPHPILFRTYLLEKKEKGGSTMLIWLVGD